MANKNLEFEDLAARFHADVAVEISKHRGSNAVGALGDFIVAIDAHRAAYAKKLDTIRADADTPTIALANEIQLKIDALASKLIQRARAAGRVEFEVDDLMT